MVDPWDLEIIGSADHRIGESGIPVPRPPVPPARYPRVPYPYPRRRRRPANLRHPSSSSSERAVGLGILATFANPPSSAGPGYNDRLELSTDGQPRPIQTPTSTSVSAPTPDTKKPEPFDPGLLLASLSASSSPAPREAGLSPLGRSICEPRSASQMPATRRRYPKQ